MSQYPEKLRVIFLPFLLVAIATIAVYTFLHWLLLIHLHVLLIDEAMVCTIIPLALPWIPLLIWIRPRLKLLKLNSSRKGNPVFGTMVFMWFAITPSLIFMQEYLITTTGNLTKLNEMSEMVARPFTKYYLVKKFYPDRQWTAVLSTFKVGGKYQRDYTITVYTVTPVFDHKLSPVMVKHYGLKTLAVKPLLVIDGQIRPDSILAYIDVKDIDQMSVIKDAAAKAIYGKKGQAGVILITTKGLDNNLKPIDPPLAIELPITWVGVKYEETISNRLSIEVKEQEYRRFFKESMAKFNSIEFNRMIYLNRLGYNDDMRKYTSVINTRYSDKIKGQAIVLSPVFESYSKRNGHNLALVLIFFTVGSAILLLVLRALKFKEE